MTIWDIMFTESFQRRWKRFWRDESGIRDMRKIKPQYRSLYRDEMIGTDCASKLCALMDAHNNKHLYES